MELDEFVHHRRGQGRHGIARHELLEDEETPTGIHRALPRHRPAGAGAQQIGEADRLTPQHLGLGPDLPLEDEPLLAGRAHHLVCSGLTAAQPSDEDIRITRGLPQQLDGAGCVDRIHQVS
ncbi:MAG: hypothetical protein ABSE98_00690 [Acidimicrobiales bacterium]